MGGAAQSQKMLHGSATWKPYRISLRRKIYPTQRTELNIEVSPKTAKFEKFVLPPIFKNCLLTFL